MPHMGAGIRTIIHNNRDLCLCGVEDWHGLHNSSNLGIYFSCSSTNSDSHSSSFQNVSPSKIGDRGNIDFRKFLNLQMYHSGNPGRPD